MLDVAGDLIGRWDAALPEGVGCFWQNPGVQESQRGAFLVGHRVEYTDAAVKAGRRHRRAEIVYEFEAWAFLGDPRDSRLARAAVVEMADVLADLLVEDMTLKVDGAQTALRAEVASIEVTAEPSGESYAARAAVTVTVSCYLT